MARPTELSAWAESAAPDDISEPVGERAEGYKAYEPWPHSQANWLFRMFTRWISWLTLKSDTHKHDGLGGDMSAPQIEANTDIFWNTPLVPHAVGSVYFDSFTSAWAFAGVGIVSVVEDSTGKFTVEFDRPVISKSAFVTPEITDDTVVVANVALSSPYDESKLSIRIKTLADVYSSKGFHISVHDRT